MRAKLSSASLIVLKLGTGILTDRRNRLAQGRVRQLVGQVARARKAGYEVVVVSSGAVGAGETLISGIDGGASADSALGNALDNNTQQGVSPGGGVADNAAGLNIVGDETSEELVEEEQVDEVAADFD